MLVLVPPSEGKAAGGAGRWLPGSGSFGRRLRVPRAEVVTALSEALDGASTPQRTRLLGLKGVGLEAAVLDDTLLDRRPPALPARERYTGVVWTALDPGSLPPPASEWLDEHVAVVSGLLGLVGASEPVPPYRLKMSVTLGELGKLSRYWRPHLTRVLKGVPVVDLLPQEHADAVAGAGDPRVPVRFTTGAGGAAGHHGKAVKGRFLRHLAQAAPATVDDVLDVAAAFADGGTAVVDAAGDRPAVEVLVGN